MADRHTAHVGDRGGWPGFEKAEVEAEMSKSSAGLGVGCGLSTG